MLLLRQIPSDRCPLDTSISVDVSLSNSTGRLFYSIGEPLCEEYMYLITF